MAAKKKTKQGSAKNSGSALPGLDISEIERLLAFMEKHNLEQFEFSRGDFRVALKRGWDGGSAPAPARSAPANPGSSRSADAPATAAAPAAPTAPVETAHIIKSPIVGTFFAAAGP